MIKKGWSAIALIFFGSIALQLVWGIVQPFITVLAVGFLISITLFIVYRVVKAIHKHKF